MKSLIIVLLAFFGSVLLSGQNVVKQNIQGKVVDEESRTPLIGVVLYAIKNDSVIRSTTTDVSGRFLLKDVPVGRVSVQATYLGYKTVFLSQMELISARAMQLEIKMREEAFAIDEVVVTSEKKGAAHNEMSVVSARSFNAEEAARFAGSRQDPARMAGNFAGVQATDDSRNDIVVRGNSPLGVLWRFENVNIPSPNHFSVAGSTGGPISVLNNNTLGTSDFYTAAFPAEFGNATSAVFDISMRNGNTSDHHYTGQIGVFGTEALVEGPINKDKNSSFIASYRYSTLQLFQALNFDLGTSAVPRYQDASFKLNFPMNDKATLSFFGIGGSSEIDIIVSDYTEYQPDLYGRKDRDQYFRTSMGVIGTDLKYALSKNTFWRTTFSLSGSDINSHHDKVRRESGSFEVDEIFPILDYDMREGRVQLASSINHKFSARSRLKGGFFVTRYGFTFIDSIYNEFSDEWELRMDSREDAFLVQPYFQWKYAFTSKIEATAGLHYQLFTLNNSQAIEPRAGMRYKYSEKTEFSLGVGLHSQMQPSYIYFAQNGQTRDFSDPYNMNLGFTRSFHSVLGYEWRFRKNMRLKAEGFYQRLFNVPVTTYSSSYSQLNQGAGFDRFFPDTLVNEGVGQNYGIDLTLEKFFSNYYYALVTASLFESRYQGSDDIWRDTDYNGNFIFNALAGAEYPLNDKKSNFLLSGFNLTWGGGRRFSPVDRAASLQSAEVVWVDSLRNTQQFRDYFRLDVRIGFKLNRPKVTHEFVVDLLNVLNTRNLLTLEYDPDITIVDPNADPLRETPQLGFLPVIYYKVDF